MKLKFTQDYATKEAKPQVFKKDQVVDFADDEAGRASAQHYLNRGVAEDVAEEAAKAKASKQTPDAGPHTEALVPGAPAKGTPHKTA